jgi:hypothetical protein
MRNRFKNLNAAAGAALVALVLAGSFAARADDRPAASPTPQESQAIAQMQARMQAMQAQMAQLQTVTDPVERQKLLSAHMELMQEQMASMRSMGGGMMQTMHGGAGMGMGTGTQGMGGGMARGGMGLQQDPNAATRAPGARHQLMEDRVDMLQMMMEQMMGQMQMQSGPHGPGR